MAWAMSGGDMAHEVRFQVLILPNVEWSELLDRFQRVEDLGFDLAVTGDHWCDWSNPPSNWFEMWTTLAGVAQATSRIRIAPCVAQIPLRNPAMLARQALTVDHISGGRLEIGLGLGMPVDPSYKMIGMENWTNKKRVAQFDEYVQIVDQLLSNEVTTFKGEFYEVNEATMNPRSPQQPRPPITVAALGPVMIGKAVKYADTWNTMSFAESFDEQLSEVQGKIALARQYCETIGRDPETLRISYNLFDAQSRATGGKIRYYESHQVFEDLVGGLADAGITEFGLYYPMLDSQMDAFASVATDLFPKLRS